MVKKLHVGKYSNKELAEWFQVTEGSFRATKKKKLEELKNYADFEIEKSKVIIKEVREPYYTRKSVQVFEKIKDTVSEVWKEDGLDSCSRVSIEVEQKLKNEDGFEFQLAPSTIYNYTRKSRNELYGKPFCERGSEGSCIYVWCKKEGDGVDTIYRRLTAEEEQLKKDLIQKYFGDATEKQILVKGMVLAGEIPQEEAWEVLEKLTNMKNEGFMSFLGELQEKVGCQVVRGTLVRRDSDRIEFHEESAF